MEAIEGLRFLASLPLAGTGRIEGGKKMQSFNRFHLRKKRWKENVGQDHDDARIFPMLTNISDLTTKGGIWFGSHLLLPQWRVK